MSEQQGGPAIWDDWVGAFLAELGDARGRRESTLHMHGINLRVMRRTLDLVGAPGDPRDLTRTHVVAAVVQLRQSGRQPRTINSKLQSLRQIRGMPPFIR